MTSSRDCNWAQPNLYAFGGLKFSPVRFKLSNWLLRVAPNVHRATSDFLPLSIAARVVGTYGLEQTVLTTFKYYLGM